MAKFSDVLTIVNGRNQKKVENPNGQYPIYGSGGIMGYADEYLCEPETVVIGRKGSINKPIFVETPFWNVDTAFGLCAKRDVLLPKYLFYFCKAFDFEKLNTTVTIPSLTKKNLFDIEMPLPHLAEQREIAGTLTQVDTAIDVCNRILSALDELVKVRFVEMFGSREQNSHNWKTLTFREACTILSDGPFGSNLKTGHYTASGVRVIRLGNIGVGNFIDNDKVFVSLEHYEKIKKYTCNAGEIVIGTLGKPNLRACIIPDYVGYAINKADCVHCVPNVEILNAHFVCHYINCPGTLSLAEKMIHGQTRSRISSGQIAEMPIFIPPLNIQELFAAFVQNTEKSKAILQSIMSRLNILQASLMQEYFG